MARHLMVDLETLGTLPNTTVLTLGAVHFDPYSDWIGEDTLYLKFNMDDQDHLGRTIDQSTIDWWGRQDPAIMEEAFSPDGRLPLDYCIDQFHKFAWGCDAFWSHGSCFDLIILEDIYRQFNRAVPWQFYQIRDTRTAFDLGIDPQMPKDSKHDALHDAVRQAIGVQNVYAGLGVKKR